MIDNDEFIGIKIVEPINPILVPELNYYDVAKHATHIQSDHGNWARGGGEGGMYSAYGARAEAIAAREGAISIIEIEDIFLTAQNEIDSPSEIDSDELRRIIDNDPDLYDVFQQAKDEALQSIAYSGVPQEKLSDYEQDAENDAVEFVQERYGELIMDYAGQSFDQGYAVEKMGNVFNYSDEKSGMYSYVTDVSFDYGNGLRVVGTVRDADNSDVGEFARTFIPDGNSFRVEHDIFRIYEKDAQGKGFGRGFIENQENTYVAAGLSRINLYSAWDGAYTWARGGYDFDPSRINESIRAMNNASWYNSGLDDIAIAKLEDLRARSASVDFKSPDFPMPHEYASLSGAKNALSGEKVYFEKILTPEGFRLREGAIDADGDGMIFDGTPRERPAPPPSFFSQPPLFDKP